MAKLNLENAPNAQMIKEVQKKSTKEINTNAIVNIPLSEIDENPDNEKVFNMDSIKALAKNISEDGFIGAIEVYKKDDGRYEISSGHRRFRAMTMLNKEYIPAIVYDMPSEIKKRRVLIASNINIRDMSPMDIARAMKYHYDTLLLETPQSKKRSSDNRLDIVADYFNVSRASATRYLRLVSLIEQLQDLVAKDIVPWTSIIACSELTKDVQKKIYEDLNKYAKDHDNKIIGKIVDNIISKYTSEPKPVKISNNPIDKQIYRIHRQLKNFSQEDIVVSDKENLKRQIAEIEDYISAIKKKL